MEPELIPHRLAGLAQSLDVASRSIAFTLQADAVPADERGALSVLMRSLERELARLTASLATHPQADTLLALYGLADRAEGDR